MSLILTFLLATSAFFHAKNGETGVLIAVQDFQLSYESQQEQTLQLCDEILEAILAYQDAGIAIHLQIPGHGQFKVLSTELGKINLDGYTTIIRGMRCHNLPHDPEDKDKSAEMNF